MRAFYELNQFYVDTMDQEVVAEFIKCTHQYYYETIPENLRSILKGVFTDEPQLSRNGLPWSRILPKKFKEKFNGDLLAELPKMQYDLSGCEAFRIKFWKLCAELFNDHFMKQIHDCCDRYGWKLTGHLAKKTEYLESDRAGICRRVCSDKSRCGQPGLV